MFLDYVTNGHRNRLLDLYSADGVKTVAENLAKVVNDPNDAEARTNLAYAADILGGYSMALDSVTSHHILAQTMGGFYQGFPHGATLITVAEAYYKKACSLLPEEFDELGELMGETRDPANPGYAYVKALIRLLDETGARDMAMSKYGVKPEDFEIMAEHAMQDACAATNPRKATKEQIIAIFQKAYDGD